MYMIETGFECNHHFCLNTYFKKEHIVQVQVFYLFSFKNITFSKFLKNYIKPESILTRIENHHRVVYKNTILTNV